MTKILMVDDEEHLEILIRQKFRKEIKIGDYTFLFARNGREALEKIDQDKEISLVVSDINMPEMDGLALLDHLDKVNPRIKVIIVSAYNDVDNVKTAMDRGAYDFITKPMDLNDFADNLRRIMNQDNLDRQDIKNLQETRPSLEEEMKAASKFQKSILPSHSLNTDQVQICAIMRSALDVGGDFYDYFWISPSKLGILVADVSGKGISAALFMGMVKTLFKLTAMDASSPGDCLAKVNKKIVEDNDLAMFVTLFYGVLDLPTGQLCYSNGGHYPPYLIDSKDCKALEIPQGAALGVKESCEYKEKTLSLSPKTTLFLYTDGVTEAFNKNSIGFSSKRVIEALLRHRENSVTDLIHNVLEDIKCFIKPSSQSDDITCLALRYRPHG